MRRLLLLALLALTACTGSNAVADWWAEALPILDGHLYFVESTSGMTPSQVGALVQVLDEHRRAFNALAVPDEAQSVATMISDAMRDDALCLADFANGGDVATAAACLEDSARWYRVGQALGALGLDVSALDDRLRRA